MTEEGGNTMRRAKMLRVVLLALVVGMLSASLVYAEKPPGTTPPTIDGLLDESYSYYVHIPGGPGDDSIAPGDLWTFETDDVCYHAFVVDRGFNDNVFANDDQDYLRQDGWTKGHGFGDLEESDGATFVIQCSETTSYTVWLDYIQYCGGQYESGGQLSDTCGSLPQSPPISETATSLYWNMTAGGWTDQTHSPSYDYNDTPDQYWEWQMIYEFSIPKSVCGGCAVVGAGGAHNSPSKEVEGLSSLGDYVWYDEPDEDGIQNNGRWGVGNVRVYLYQAVDTVNPYRTTSTANGTGYYIFNNLPAGNYFVQFDGNTLPLGYDFTLNQNAGTDDALDSDADPDRLGGWWGWTEEIVLPLNTHDPTWDAGIVTAGGTAVTLSSFAARGLGTPSALSLGLALLLAAGGLLWVRRRTS
jgi:hypothetical protein